MTHSNILIDAGIRFVESVLESGFTAENALKIAPEAVAFCDYLIQKMDRKWDAPPEIACQAGCPYCCSMQVSLTPPEAILIGNHIQKTYSSSDMDTLFKKITSNLDLTDGKSLDEKVENWNKTPCVLLEEGSCSIYPIRPFICRSWISLDKNQCVTAYTQKDKQADIDNLPYRNLIFGTVRDGMQEGCKIMGLQSDKMVITKALRAFLNHDKPIEKWLSGENIF